MDIPSVLGTNREGPQWVRCYQFAARRTNGRCLREADLRRIEVVRLPLIGAELIVAAVKAPLGFERVRRFHTKSTEAVAHARCSRPIRRNLSREPDSVSITIDASVSATIRRSPTSRAAPVRSTRAQTGGTR